MPEAIPIPRSDRFLQLIRSDASAPRTEISRTSETEPPFRYGMGKAYRIGRYALVLGRWTGQAPERGNHTDFDGLKARAQRYIDDMNIDETFDDVGVRTLTREEIERLGEQMRTDPGTDERMRRGWIPPRWHWRRYRKPVLSWLSREHTLQLGRRVDVTVGPWVAIDLYGDVRRLDKKPL